MINWKKLIRQIYLGKRILFIAEVLTIFQMTPLLSQEWIPSGPDGGWITAAEKCGATIIVGTYTGDLYRSDESLKKWSHVVPSFSKIRINQIVNCKGHLYATNWNSWNLFTSLDTGKTWKRVSYGKDTIWAVATIVNVNDTVIVVGYTGILYKSLNNGISWEPPDSSLQKNAPDGISVHDAGVGRNNIFIATNFGIYRSDNGTNWQCVRKVDHGKIFVKDDTLFAGQDQGCAVEDCGLAISYDGGQNWTVNDYLFMVHVTSFSNGMLIAKPTDFSLGRNSTIFESFNTGRTWQQVEGTINETKIWWLWGYDSTIIANTTCCKLFHSNSSMGKWEESDSGLNNMSILGLAVHGNQTAVVSSQFLGDTFQVITTDTAMAQWNQQKTKSYIYTGLQSKSFFGSTERTLFYANSAILYHLNQGDTLWRAIDAQGSGVEATFSAFTIKDDTLFYALSINNNSKSIAIKRIVQQENGISSPSVAATFSDTSATILSLYPYIPFLVGTNKGIYRMDSSLSYPKIASSGIEGRSIVAINKINDIVFAGSDKGMYCYYPDKKTWLLSNNGLPDTGLISFIKVKNTTVFAGISGSGVYFSKDSGGFWEKVTTGLECLHLTGLEICDNKLIAATGNNSTFVLNISGIANAIPLNSIPRILAPKTMVFRNNMRNFIKVTLTLPEKSCIEVSIYNAKGSRIALIRKALDKIGNNTFLFNENIFPKGVYLIAVTSEKWRQVAKMAIY